MKLLKRLLGGGPCGCPQRFGRRGGRKRAGLVFGADARRRKHQQVCDECRLRERREQQYLERLRRAAVPLASEDLTARLLARTGDLARAAGHPDGDPRSPGHPDAEPPATGHPGAPLRAAGHPGAPLRAAGHPGAPLRAAGHPEAHLPGTLPFGGQPWGPAPRGVRQRTRLAALAAGAAAAAVALMTGSAYLMGASPPPLAAGEASTAFLQKDLGLSSAAGPAPGWSMPGEPDISPADALSAEQLTALRDQGWTCPELRALGFHLVWARGGAVAGADVVELRLTDGGHFATVIEQHPGRSPNQGGAGLPQPGAGAPVNVLTGHSAGADGFTAVGLSGTVRPADNSPGTSWGGGSGGLWINPAPPFRAIVQVSDGTFTYVSDQSADEAGVGLAALVRASALLRPETQADVRGTPAGAAGAGTQAGIQARIERGLGRILELLAP